MHPSCPVCGGSCVALDEVDFNKSCEEARGTHLLPSGIAVQYLLCEQCGFAFAPQFAAWSLEDFASRIYNDGYAAVDPDYLDARPRANAQMLLELLELLAARGPEIRHLDYGGGSGLLSALLRGQGWNSASYDPFVDRDLRPETLGRFDLVTCFEVFEHVPDVHQLMASLSSLAAEDGIVLFSTMLSDGNIRAGERPDWWYAAPRNGHISLFSRKSLAILCARAGFSFGSFSTGFHAMWKTVPAWAAHFLRPA